MKKIIPLLLIMFQTSCDFQLSEEFKPTYKPQIVLNSLFTEGKDWQVFISKNIPAWNQKKDIEITNIDHFIKNAEVFLYEGEKLLTILPYKDKTIKVTNHTIEPNSIPCYTTSTYFPRSGQVYRIKVIAEGFPAVEAEGKVPMPILIYDLAFRKEATSNQNLSKHKVSFKIKDDFNVKNYYMLQVVTEEEHNGTYRHYTSQPLLSSDDPILKSGLNFWEKNQYDIDSEEPLYFNFIFPDDLFNGEEAHMSFRIWSWGENQREGSIRHRATLYSMEEEMYEYFQTQTRQVTYREDIFADILPITTNVKNGLGIFAGYQNASFTIVDTDK
ncbi:MAG TPA: DUF4249 domain-containing protein [Rhodothermales bacterium]|nr:DUF4249 domain-containing protein [Rhodothermales bacterium]